MPRKLTKDDTEQMIVGYLINKIGHYDDLRASFEAEEPGTPKDILEDFSARGRGFTMHELEDQCRVWWLRRGEPIAGTTFVRAAFRVIKSGVLGNISKKRVKGKKYNLYTHDSTRAELTSRLLEKEYRDGWKHPGSIEDGKATGGGDAAAAKS